MPATVELCETNGPSTGTVTHNISNSNMGDLDTANMSAPSHPIVPGNRSMAKYQRLHVTNMDTSSSIDDIRFWQTGALAGTAVHLTNLKTSAYGGAPTYAEPVAAAIAGVTNNVPTALPNSANLGIGGSLAGALTAIGYSDYFIHQLLTGANDPTGAAATLNCQYGEIL